MREVIAPDIKVKPSVAMLFSSAARAKQLNSSAPVNYVAGLGRGATGFTTRSDIGPARMSAENDEAGKLNDSKYDEFAGYQGSLFDQMPYDEDDEAADRVWNEIDAHMDERRKSRREQRIAEQLSQFRSVRPKLQHQFTDLKRDLQQVTEQEWNDLPEPGEHRKHSAAEKRNERYIPAPDSLLEKARQEQEVVHSLDARQMQTGGMETPMTGQIPMTPEMMNEMRYQKDVDERNRPWTDEDLDALFPPEGYEILQPPSSYKPLETPSRKLLATPTPGGTPGYAMPQDKPKEAYSVPQVCQR